MKIYYDYYYIRPMDEQRNVASSAKIAMDPVNVAACLNKVRKSLILNRFHFGAQYERKASVDKRHTAPSVKMMLGLCVHALTGSLEFLASIIKSRRQERRSRIFITAFRVRRWPWFLRTNHFQFPEVNC